MQGDRRGHAGGRSADQRLTGREQRLETGCRPFWLRDSRSRDRARGRGALAQSFPERPLRILVGYAPGGPADALARIGAQVLSEGLGQPVIVENRLGAGGSIAAGIVAQAPADGYTLLLSATSDVINSLINREVQYNIETSFAPIALIASAPNVLVVHPSVASWIGAGADMTAWFGLLAPAGTPAQIVSRISEIILKGVRSGDVRKRIGAIGGEPGHMTPAEFARYIRAEDARWKKLFSDGLPGAEQ